MDRGVDVHLFTRSRLSPGPGLHVHSLNGPGMTRTRQSIAFIRRVDRELENGRFDIVHAITPCRQAHVYQPRGGLVAETIERNVALRSSRSARSLKRVATKLNLRQQYLLGLERRLLSEPHGPIVVAISEYVARQLSHHYAVPRSRIRKIFNGVDPDATDPEQRAKERNEIRQEYGLAESDLVSLSVAHNFRLKGVHRWMQALAMLRVRGIKDVRALVIGRGESPAWHRLARRLNLEKALIFVGSTDRVSEFYHAGDVLVHPTYYDPCSRVVLEAMSRGLPCVTTRWDGAAEVIDEGRSGFVLEDPTDVAGH
jgi:UDP-glucose:(heptosyl)LPS alpha-1,3-glucosyltransferase